jgi:predicted amidophosphoribosyltransferase
MKTTTHLPTSCCPTCRAKVDAATDPYGNASPSPGDFTICATCAAPLVYADDMTVRSATAAECAELEADPDAARILRFIQARGQARALRAMQRRSFLFSGCGKAITPGVVQ